MNEGSLNDVKLLLKVDRKAINFNTAKVIEKWKSWYNDGV